MMDVAWLWSSFRKRFMFPIATCLILIGESVLSDFHKWVCFICIIFILQISFKNITFQNVHNCFNYTLILFYRSVICNLPCSSSPTFKQLPPSSSPFSKLVFTVPFGVSSDTDLNLQRRKGDLICEGVRAKTQTVEWLSHYVARSWSSEHRPGTVPN